MSGKCQFSSMLHTLKNVKVCWKVLPLFCGMLGIGSVASAATFKHVYDELLASNPEYQAELFRYKARRQVIVQARSRLLPQVSLTGTYSVIDEGRETIDDDVLASQSEANNISDSSGNEGSETPRLEGFSFEGESVPAVDDYESNTATLRLVQPIIDREKWAGFRQAVSSAKESKLELDKTHEELFLKLVRAYLGFASIHAQLSIVDQELDALNEQNELTESRHRERLGNLTDVYETNSRYLSVSANKERFIADQQRFESELVELLGEEIFARINQERLSLNIAFIATWVKNHSLDDLFDESSSIDPDIKLAKQKVKTAQYRYQQQNSGFMPTLSLEAQSSISETTDSFFTNEEERTRNELMLRLTIPIFSGFDTYSKSKAAYLNIQSAKESLRAENVSHDKGVRTAFSRFYANQKRVLLLERSYENIKKAVELRRQGYLQGLSSNLNFLDALNNSYSSFRQLETAKYDLAISWIEAISTVKNVGEEQALQINSLFELDQ